MDRDILHYLVELPMVAFTPLAIAAGVDAWTWLLRQRPEAEVAIIGAITAGWMQTIIEKKGFFNNSMKCVNVSNLSQVMLNVEIKLPRPL